METRNRSSLMLSACSSTSTQHRDGLSEVNSVFLRKTFQPGLSRAFTPVTSPIALFMEMLRTRAPAAPGTLSPGHLKTPVFFATYGPISQSVKSSTLVLSFQIFASESHCMIPVTQEFLVAVAPG